MKKIVMTAAIALMAGGLQAQDLKPKDIPAVVKEGLVKKYPEATKVSWEKEKGNYEANWGGKSGEDNSALFKPDGTFVEIVKAISQYQLCLKTLLLILKSITKVPKYARQGK